MNQYSVKMLAQLQLILDVIFTTINIFWLMILCIKFDNPFSLFW